MSANDKWDRRYLALAGHVAFWSKDPSTCVGAVLLSEDRRREYLGYNGFPRGVEDDPVILADRPAKYLRTIHAEMNALLKAGRDAEGGTLYSTLFTCAGCAKHAIQSGVKKLVTFYPVDVDRWKDEFDAARDMYRQAGVELVFYEEVNGGTRIRRM